MRRPRYQDFVCLDCGHEEERLVETNDDGSPCEMQKCTRDRGICNDSECTALEHPEDLHAHLCEGAMAPCDRVSAAYMQTINRNNADFSDRERERLTQRSNEHWSKKGRDEAVDRERALFKKYEGQG